MTDVAGASSALFVPGHRADRFGKAAASGADFVILDLEDAVGPDEKDSARDAVLQALTAESGLRAAVRINSLDENGGVDLAVLEKIVAGVPDRLIAVVVPKAEDAVALAEITARVPGVALLPLIETARGLDALGEIAGVPQVVRIGFGAIDFSVDLDAASSVLLDYARCQIVLASRLAGIAAPIDSPQPEFRNLEIVAQGAAASRALGFGGQLCIHPAQIPAVTSAFLPTVEEIEWARRVIGVGSGSATQVDGAMVDRPVFLRAQAVMVRAKLS